MFEKISKYNGVTNFRPSSKTPWRAWIYISGKTHNLGSFKTEIIPPKSVNVAACKNYNKPIKNTELSDEEEEEKTFSSPEIFNKPSEIITWANHCYFPIAVTPDDFDVSIEY